MAFIEKENGDITEDWQVNIYDPARKSELRFTLLRTDRRGAGFSEWEAYRGAPPLGNPIWKGATERAEGLPRCEAFAKARDLFIGEYRPRG